MDTLLNDNWNEFASKDRVRSNDVNYDASMDDVVNTKNVQQGSPNYLRIPLKPMEQQLTGELINEKR